MSNRPTSTAGRRAISSPAQPRCRWQSCRKAPGGQAGTSSRIENYLGFPDGVSGQDLARDALLQAHRFDVEVLNPIDVRSLRIDGPFKHLQVGENRGEAGAAALPREI